LKGRPPWSDGLKKDVKKESTEVHKKAARTSARPANAFVKTPAQRTDKTDRGPVSSFGFVLQSMPEFSLDYPYPNRTCFEKKFVASWKYPPQCQSSLPPYPHYSRAQAMCAYFHKSGTDFLRGCALPVITHSFLATHPRSAM
jgi:hypothetical protein